MPRDKKQYIVYGYMRQLTQHHLIDLFDIVLLYYRNPLLFQTIADQLRKRYNAKYALYFVDFVNKRNLDCKAIFMDITHFSMNCHIINHFKQLNDQQLNLLELHELLRKVCVGSSSFSNGHCQIIHNFNQFLTSNRMNNNENKINLNLSINGIDDDEKLRMCVFLYCFAYYWLYKGNKHKNKRNRANVVINSSIQYFFKYVDRLEIPYKIAKRLIKDENVKQSVYFVRNILNEYLKNTFIPFATE